MRRSGGGDGADDSADLQVPGAAMPGCGSGSSAQVRVAATERVRQLIGGEDVQMCTIVGAGNTFEARSCCAQELSRIIGGDDQAIAVVMLRIALGEALLREPGHGGARGLDGLCLDDIDQQAVADHEPRARRRGGWRGCAQDRDRFEDFVGALAAQRRTDEVFDGLAGGGGHETEAFQDEVQWRGGAG
jgi:hypothetical protein